MKQEQVRPNPEGGSYEDGTKAGWLIQLAERASRMACSIQLTRSATWTDPTRRTGELIGASCPTRPFGELDDGCLLSGIRFPRLWVTFLEDLSCESFLELLRNSI